MKTKYRLFSCRTHVWQLPYTSNVLILSYWKFPQGGLHKLSADDMIQYTCDCCGESTGANWIRLAGDQKLCLDCYKSYDRFNV